jgi:hypothetical protein
MIVLALIFVTGISSVYSAARAYAKWWTPTERIRIPQASYRKRRASLPSFLNFWVPWPHRGLALGFDALIGERFARIAQQAMRSPYTATLYKRQFPRRRPDDSRLVFSSASWGRIGNLCRGRATLRGGGSLIPFRAVLTVVIVAMACGVTLVLFIQARSDIRRCPLLRYGCFRGCFSSLLRGLLPTRCIL